MRTLVLDLLRVGTIALAFAGTVAHSEATAPLNLTGENLAVTTVPGGLAVQGDCGSGAFTFQASAFSPEHSTLNPAGTTFTEAGGFTITGAPGSPALTAFQASFSFPTTSPAGQVTGIKTLSSVNNVVCDGTVVTFSANVSYTAQITTATDTFVDHGTSQVNLTYTLTDATVRTFSQNFASAGSQMQSCVAPPGEMLSWWPGDDTPNDIVGGNNGTWTGGPAYAPGAVADAFSFDGTKYVTAGDPANLRLTGSQVTIDGWIKPAAAVNDVVYFGKTAYGNNDYVLLFQFSQLTGMIKAGGTETIVASSTTPFVPPLNQWTHIALTYDGATLKLYVNGLVIGSLAKAGTLDGTNSEFAIGGRALDPFGRHFFYTGEIDEVEAFNRALSDAEIQAIYFAGSAGKCKSSTAVNQPPVAVCQSRIVVAPANSCQVPASVDGGSHDPDGDALTLSQSPAGPYGLGITPVTLTAQDPGGLSSQCQTTVTVLDQTPPAVGATSASPNALWPPNHKMVPVTILTSATDNCGSASCQIVSVSSNEPLDADGDWTITGNLTLNLRAERLGTGAGRVYTVTVLCTDASGNGSTKTVKVTVPHDQGH
jgi:hypothetical protein